MTEEQTRREEFRVSGEEVLKKIKDIIAGGNARRIIIQNEDGKTILEIPLTVAVVGAVLAPTLVAVGALAGILTKCTIVVEKRV